MREPLVQQRWLQLWGIRRLWGRGGRGGGRAEAGAPGQDGEEDDEEDDDDDDEEEGDDEEEDEEEEEDDEDTGSFEDLHEGMGDMRDWGMGHEEWIIWALKCQSLVSMSQKLTYQGVRGVRLEGESEGG